MAEDDDKAPSSQPSPLVERTWSFRSFTERSRSSQPPRPVRFVISPEPQVADKMPHFLDACARCGAPLSAGHDTFMYADAAFCTETCRQVQIDEDEAKEKKARAKSLAEGSGSSGRLPLPGHIVLSLKPPVANQLPHFLDACARCSAPLSAGGDTFMYADAAFCTEKCRQVQIDEDVAKEKKATAK